MIASLKSRNTMGNRNKDAETRLNLKPGDWVQVRSKREILRTLDAKGQLDGMPFTPEMFAFCGKWFRVYKRAHKTCDTVFPIRSRRVDRAVFLDTRCDGSAHGGCQAGCLLFWREEWLKPIGSTVDTNSSVPRREMLTAHDGCSESIVQAATQAFDPESGTPIYTCQATQLPYFTADLSWWDVRQYIEDYRSGNVGLRRMFAGLIYSIYYNLCQAGIGVGAPLRWLYDRFAPLWTHHRFPRRVGTIPVGKPTPTATLNLQPGEIVRVKSHKEILSTIDQGSRNRGLRWDAEMVPYCGGTYRVLRRVTRIIDEKTGKMLKMKNPCIILDSVVCQARYSGNRMFCPRAIYPYWREVWLDRVEQPPIVGSVASR